MESTEIITAIVNGGVLVVVLALLLKGELISRVVVDRILKEAENRAAAITQAIFEDMQIKVKNAVREGMIEAQEETRGSFSHTRTSSERD